MRAYHASGDARYEIQQPTRDPGLITSTIACVGERAAAELDFDRGHLEIIVHQDVRGAWAGSTAVLAAPDASGRRWVWAVRLPLSSIRSGLSACGRVDFRRLGRPDYARSPSM